MCFLFLLGSECGAVLEPTPGQSNCGSAISGKMLIPIGQRLPHIFVTRLAGLSHWSAEPQKPDVEDWSFFLIGHA